MALRKTWSNNISTPILTSTDPANIVAILHDHGYLITMSPIVTRYEKENSAASDTGIRYPSAGEKINYQVWENIDLLPGALWRKEITFHCAFQNTDTGVVSWINAPMGLTSQATYTVKHGESGDESWVLDESIESSCSVFLKSFVEKTMVKTREEMHQKILQKAAERGKTSQPAL